MNDYERIAKVIRYLDKRFAEQPNLETLAKEIGLSESHFHRLFSKWAGVTPKDFLQCLTLTHVKKMLNGGMSVLNTTFDSGLSSPGRLHDLCVTLEAASPGELKSGGTGMAITAGFSESPFGTCLVGETTRGICHLSFVDLHGKNSLFEIKKNWPNADIKLNNAAAKKLVNQIFSGDAANLRTWVKGTEFQIRVWRALLNIQPGTLVSYAQLAERIGHSRASRAVGTAVGENLIAYLIPCHRVIRGTGIIGDYRWGGTRKRAMVAWETVRFSQPGQT